MQTKRKIKPIQIWAACIHVIWRLIPRTPRVRAVIVENVAPKGQKDDYWDKFFTRAPFCIYETTGQVVAEEYPTNAQRLLIGG